jgi:hypothetical protein
VLVKRGDPLPPAHARAEVMSLPYLFKTLLNTVPAPIPYIFPDDALVQSWREELARALPNAVGKKFRVGIVWQGSVALDNDRERSIELATFAPLAAVPGVQLVSLQKGRGTEQIQALQGRFPLLDLGGRLDEANGAFVDTAAVMKSLDLVISSDTSVPHLAGAMGIPVWIAIAKAPDWRWMLEREDTPWYPTMRLFRRGTGENWDQLFARIAGALSDCSKRMNFA